ncbi:hypothetical protein ACFL6S_06380 [Candidatus Poribacteria bacterium]
MHYSQQHDYSGNASEGSNGLGDGLDYDPEQATLGSGPNEKLLRNSASNLCLSCHDDQTFAPDVMGAQSESLTHVRQAGALNRVGDTGDYAEGNGHSIGSQHPDVPGGACINCHNVHNPPLILNHRLFPLECISCHDPHGNTRYRNLSELDGVSVSYNVGTGTNALANDVFLRSWKKTKIADNYSSDNVDFNEPDPNGSKIGDFCGICHGLFHGNTLPPPANNDMYDGANWLRHPTADADIGDLVSDGKHTSLTIFGGNRNRLKVMSPTGVWGTQGTSWENPPEDLTPTCITCHKAHGNKNPFALIYMAGGTGTVSEEGTTDPSGTFSDLCKQCHVQGNPE